MRKMLINNENSFSTITTNAKRKLVVVTCIRILNPINPNRNKVKKKE